MHDKRTPPVKRPHIKSVETRYLEERDSLFRGLQSLDRRTFMKVSAGAAAAAAASGVSHHFHSFLPINVAGAAESTARQPFTFAYISDSHLYIKKTNERFIRQLLRAVDDVNAMDPQPDFVLYGGDLAQLGRKEELDLGAQVLKSAQSARSHDGGRARLVLRHGTPLERAVRAGELQLQSQGRPLRRAHERAREGLLDSRAA